VAAANQAYFNNSYTCGECYQITGPSGTIMVVIADECPVKGNPLCDGRMIHFDLGEQATFAALAPSSAGTVLEKIVKIACPVTGGFGFKFVPGTSEWYVAFIVYNHKVGITDVELQPTNGSAYYQMDRNSNQWEYNAQGGPVTTPYNVRLTAITGEQIVVSLDTFTEKTVVPTNDQFADPPTDFGGSTPGACAAPLPPDVIFDDFLYNGNGAPSNAWDDWSFNTQNNFADTKNPYAGTQCWSSKIGGYGGIQLGRTIPITWGGIFTNLQFAIRADTAYSQIALSWGSGQAVTLNINTTWQVMTLSLTSDLDSPAQIGDSVNGPLTLKNNAGTSAPTIYLDEVVFTPRDNASYVNPNYPPGIDSESSAITVSISVLPISIFALFVMWILRFMAN